MTWLWILVGLALGACLPLFGLAAHSIIDALRNRAHRLRVARAVAAGWTPPRLSRNWSVVNTDDIAYEGGITAITATPDRGIEVRDYARHARTVQRQVEEAWLAGIAEVERQERADLVADVHA